MTFLLFGIGRWRESRLLRLSWPNGRRPRNVPAGVDAAMPLGSDPELHYLNPNREQEEPNKCP